VGDVSSEDWNALSPQQRSVIAKAWLGGDLSTRGAANFAEVDPGEAAEALELARNTGLIAGDGTIDDVVQARLVGDLTSEDRARVHTRAAQSLLAAGPERLPDALHHLRSAATLTDAEPAVELADNAGRLSLSLGDYSSAAQLLALAVDYDVSSELERQGHRLCDLAAAVDGLGDLELARRHAARAVALGELAGDPALVARAAVAHALPVDWHAGDQRTHGLLARADRQPLSPQDRVAVMAARALAEMRIPVIAGDHHQVAWVTRPSVAQPLAQQAVADAATCPPMVRCLAALAWRSTHRAPRYLDQRRELSSQALELAQTIRHPSFQVEAAVWLAVDALESGDRLLADEALSVAQWVAQRDGNPRLQFRALTLAMGAAMLDGDSQRTHDLLKHCLDIVSRLDASLLLVVQTFFAGQLVISEDDPGVLAGLNPDPSAAIMAHPLGRVAAGYAWARGGHIDLAVEHTRRALVQRDEESSLLLVGTRAAAVAYETGDKALCREVIDVLSPHADHVAVDSNGWWCDGPVAVWLAMLHQRVGEHDAARDLARSGEATARSLRDVRSLQRLEALRGTLAPVDGALSPAAEELTARERSVLRQLATGATNPEIAQQLAYSVSTIRNDTIAIYRKLGVTGRPEAVARGVALGLLSLGSEA
jgi:DNA-binding CsgD family transcriptional regulator/tetratricopeptide (TPR) repeat protein